MITPNCTHCDDFGIVLQGDGCAPCPLCHDGAARWVHATRRVAELAAIACVIVIAAAVWVTLP